VAWTAAAAALLAAVIAASVHGAAARRLSAASGLEGLLLPLASLALAGVLLGSAVAAGVRGGVLWRGTLYPLEGLRAGVVRERDWPASGAAGWPASEAGPEARRPVAS
jgi:hypothetical protein